MWNVITYPFNGADIEVWEWECNFITQYLARDYLSMILIHFFNP